MAPVSRVGLAGDEMNDTENKDTDRYYIEGRLIYEEGYAAGNRIYAGAEPKNPYGGDHWMAQVWADGYRCGKLDRMSLSEPPLSYPS